MGKIKRFKVLKTLYFPYICKNLDFDKLKEILKAL